MGKVMEEKISMAFENKFNTFVLPYPELHVTGDVEVILKKVSLQLCPFPTSFPYPLVLAMSEKLLGFYQLLDFSITALLSLTNGISVM